jgi:hypothetical protein
MQRPRRMHGGRDRRGTLPRAFCVSYRRKCLITLKVRIDACRARQKCLLAVIGSNDSGRRKQSGHCNLDAVTMAFIGCTSSTPFFSKKNINCHETSNPSCFRIRVLLDAFPCYGAKRGCVRCGPDH